MKVAEALLLRKQLEAKVQQLQPLKNLGDNGVFEQKIERRAANENVGCFLKTPSHSLLEREVAGSNPVGGHNVAPVAQW